jgi:CheY-like chemotaxis protein
MECAPQAIFPNLNWQTPSADKLHMARALLINDERDIAHVMRLLLEARGHEVFIAEDGSRGLAVAQRQKPDVIVLDLMMPVMDGFNSLESLQADPRTESIPVIVVSAMQAEQAEQRCYAMGARAYVRKPFDADILIGAIEEIAQEHSAASRSCSESSSASLSPRS